MSSGVFYKKRIKILKEVHTHIIKDKVFINYGKLIEFVDSDENRGIFENVMVHPLQDDTGCWIIKTFVFK